MTEIVSLTVVILIIAAFMRIASLIKRVYGCVNMKNTVNLFKSLRISVRILIVIIFLILFNFRNEILFGVISIFYEDTSYKQSEYFDSRFKRMIWWYRQTNDWKKVFSYKTQNYGKTKYIGDHNIINIFNSKALFYEGAYKRVNFKNFGGLRNLTNLESVDIRDRFESVYGISCLINLKNLNFEFSPKFDSLKERDIADLRSLKNLESFGLAAMNFDFSILDGFDKLRSINIITSYGTTNNWKICEFTELQKLSIRFVHGKNISDELTHLKKMDKLLVLRLVKVGNTTGFLPANLEHLDISWNGIESIQKLSELTNLSYLDLSVNKIDDLSPLFSLQKLDTLLIYNNPINDWSQLDSLKVSVIIRTEGEYRDFLKNRKKAE